MRRILAAVLILVTVTAAAGSASALGFGLLDTPSPQPTEQIAAFTFRNGIGWNMSTEQVRVLEETPMTERTSTAGEWSVMLTNEKVTVSRFAANLIFMFRQNQLRMITYEFSTEKDSVISFYYLIGALESKYGKSKDGEPQAVKNLMDRIDPNHYQTDRIQQVHAWAAKDGTGIYLYFFNTDRFAILYACPELNTAGGEYDVNGL
jgi:hypothetical protein